MSKNKSEFEKKEIEQRIAKVMKSLFEWDEAMCDSKRQCISLNKISQESQCTNEEVREWIYQHVKPFNASEIIIRGDFCVLRFRLSQCYWHIGGGEAHIMACKEIQDSAGGNECDWVAGWCGEHTRIGSHMELGNIAEAIEDGHVICRKCLSAISNGSPLPTPIYHG